MRHYLELGGGNPKIATQTANQTAWADATAIATPASGKRIAVMGLLICPTAASDLCTVGFYTSGASQSKNIAFGLNFIVTANPIYIDLSECPVIGDADHVVKAIVGSGDAVGVNVYYYEI